MTPEREHHRRFLNSYYGRVKHFYDVTRRCFLFGRDRALAELLEEPWESLIEVGPGTGRNLDWLRRRRPTARYGGIDASDEMLGLARERCPWAALAHGYAEEADYVGLWGAPPERILFSYCLSMVQDPRRAIERARSSVAPGGQVWVVDFGDMSDMALGARALRGYLQWFRVHIPDHALLREHGAELRWGPGRYYMIARMDAAVAAPSKVVVESGRAPG